MAAKVHLLMTVYRGDRHWRPALVSVERGRHIFDQLIVSFDGPTRAELVTYLGNLWPAELNATLLETPAEMTWSEHVQWLGIQPEIAALNENDFIMIMSEDDVILPLPLQQGICQTLEAGRAVMFGPWADTQGQVRINPAHAHGATITRPPLIARRLAKLSREAPITSVAGLTMPVTAFRRYVALHGPYGTPPLIGGVRAEYFMASQSGVEALVEAPAPTIAVKRHEGQGSRGISRSEWIQDECLYQFWIMTDPRNLPQRDRLMAFLRFSKRMVQNPRAIRRVVPAIRVFKAARGEVTVT